MTGNPPLYCIHTKKLSCLKSGVEFDMNDILYELTFPEFHFETEAKVDFPSACIQQRRQKFE